MKIGKLDSDLLEDIVFKHIKYRRPEVLVRAGIGEDCAVIDYDGSVCVLSTDPITGAVSEIGRLAVHVSCNDIASNGIEPLGIMLAAMLPEDITADQIETIMKQAGEEAEKLGVEIIGGHTEITRAVNQPVIVSTAIGRCKKEDFISGFNVKAGDAIIMTKTAGMEGIGILAHDFEEKLLTFITNDELNDAKAMMDQLSVKTEGLIAGKLKASGMHDVTEGGILGAVWEMCEASGVGADVFADKIPVAEVTRKICDKLKIDVLHLISSGCMLIIVDEGKKREILDSLSEAGIQATCIGVVNQAERRVIRDGAAHVLCPPKSDQLYEMIDRISILNGKG